MQNDIQECEITLECIKTLFFGAKDWQAYELHLVAQCQKTVFKMKLQFQNLKLEPNNKIKSKRTSKTLFLKNVISELYLHIFTNIFVTV